MTDDGRVRLGWDEYGAAARDLAATIVADGFRPVSDSGRTLALVHELLGTVAAEVRTACLYTKPGTVHEPHYSWARTDRWILFPWSAEGPVPGANTVDA